MNKLVNAVRCATCRGIHPTDGHYIGRRPVVEVDGITYQLEIVPPYGNTWIFLREDGTHGYVTLFGATESLASAACQVREQVTVCYAPLTEQEARWAAARLPAVTA